MKGYNPPNNTVKFGKNPPSGLEEIMADEGQTTTNALLDPMAQVSLNVRFDITMITSHRWRAQA